MSKRDEMAEKWVAYQTGSEYQQNDALSSRQTPQFTLKRAYLSGFDAAIEEVLQTMNEMLAPTSPTMFELRTKIKSPRERV